MYYNGDIGDIESTPMLDRAKGVRLIKEATANGNQQAEIFLHGLVDGLVEIAASFPLITKDEVMDKVVARSKPSCRLFRQHQTRRMKRSAAKMSNVTDALCVYTGSIAVSPVPGSAEGGWPVSIFSIIIFILISCPMHNFAAACTCLSSPLGVRTS